MQGHLCQNEELNDEVIQLRFTILVLKLSLFWIATKIYDFLAMTVLIYSLIYGVSLVHLSKRHQEVRRLALLS